MTVTAQAVIVENVVKNFGAIRAVDDVAFDVRPGEMFGLIGPDGAGKTTIIRLLCGLLRPDAGRIMVLGLDPVRQHANLTQQIGYFSQRFSLYGDLSIDENISFFAEVHGLKRYEERRNRLLELTQLTPFRHRLADRLSGGMKQKLALACTLVHQPQIIVLDEPTTGVDPVSRREFWKLLSEFLSQGITIILATPYLDEAERCSRVGLFSDGRLLVVDTPAALRRSLPGAITEVMSPWREAAVTALESDNAVVETQSFGERVHARWQTDDADEAVRRAREVLSGARVEVTHIRTIPASLEDVFINRIASAAGRSPTAAPQKPM